MSLSKVYESRRCIIYGFISEEILHVNIEEKLCSQAPYLREIKSKTLILPELSSLDGLTI